MFILQSIGTFGCKLFSSKNSSPAECSTARRQRATLYLPRSPGVFSLDFQPAPPPVPRSQSESVQCHQIHFERLPRVSVHCKQLNPFPPSVPVWHRLVKLSNLI